MQIYLDTGLLIL